MENKAKNYSLYFPMDWEEMLSIDNLSIVITQIT
jgi:hypothetical protein